MHLNFYQQLPDSLSNGPSTMAGLIFCPPTIEPGNRAAWQYRKTIRKCGKTCSNLPTMDERDAAHTRYLIIRT